MSDMLESGVPVVNGYISDIHGNEDIPALSSACKNHRNRYLSSWSADEMWGMG